MSVIAPMTGGIHTGRVGCQGCLEQRASTSYGEQTIPSYSWSFQGNHSRFNRTAAPLGGFCSKPFAGFGDCGFAIQGLGNGGVCHSMDVTGSNSAQGAIQSVALQPAGNWAMSNLSRRGRRGLGSVRPVSDRFSLTQTSAGLVRLAQRKIGRGSGKRQPQFRPSARAAESEVQAPSENDVIDIDSLDLNDENASNIIREAKIEQLSRLSYEELRKLPREQRLVPKKRGGGKKNPFFRLGDPIRLEKIRKTLKPKVAEVADDDSDDEGLVSDEGEKEDTSKRMEYSLSALLQMDDGPEDLGYMPKRKKYSVVTGQYANEKIAAMKKAGLLPKKTPREEVIENEMRERPRPMQTRKSILAEHFAAHLGSAQAMIRKVMRMWEEGEIKPEIRGPRNSDEETQPDVECGLSYDDSRLHVPFRFGPLDAFHELQALPADERSRFFSQGFLDALEQESNIGKMEAFKEEFYKTLIQRAQAVNTYCQSLAQVDFGVDSSSLDMAVYLTRFLTRNYKDPTDISAIIAAVEDRIDFLHERLHINREMAVALLISYPRYFSPFCDLEKRVDDVLMVLERLDYDKESMIRLIFKNPSLFNNPLQRIADNIKVLQAFGLAEPEFATRVPWLLGLNLMQRLAERVALLRKYGISDAEMPVCFQRNLYLFVSTIDTCKSRLDYLEGLGRGRDWVRQLVVSRPKIICCHLERQVSRLQDALRKVGLKPPTEELVDLIVTNTPLYQMSGKKLDEGLTYLTKELGLSPEVFMEFPQAVGYSLEGRTKPRIKICQSLGLVIADRGQPGLSLAQILVTTFPTFKYCIESGIWLRKYGGHVKQLEYDETGKVLAGLAEAEADYIDDDNVEVEIDLPEITSSGQT